MDSAPGQGINEKQVECKERRIANATICIFQTMF